LVSIVAAGVREHRTKAADDLYLEFAGSRQGQEDVAISAGVRELSAGGVVLKFEDVSGKVDAANLQGREAIIRLREVADPERGRIKARVLWARPQGDKAGAYLIGLELADPELQVRKMLEDRLQAYPGDIKELWDQWDRVHVCRLPLKADYAVYLVAAIAIGGGTGLYFLGPESLKLYGSILAIYGCLMMAGKSVWAMWQERVVARE
jgi:Tfp pilus assembly protein PilZ